MEPQVIRLSAGTTTSMATKLRDRSTYQSYPFLTNEEFAEACHYMDTKYCQAALGPLRRKWRLHVHTALDTSATSRDNLVTFLQISKPLDNSDTDDQLASRLGNVALDEPAPTRRSKRQAMHQAARQAMEESMADSMMIDAEEADKEALRYSSRASFQSSYAVYEIHLHPTYRAPCLWFSLHNLPIDESPLDAETVFRRLVPDQFKQALRGQSAIGGISIEVRDLTNSEPIAPSYHRRAVIFRPPMFSRRCHVQF